MKKPAKTLIGSPIVVVPGKVFLAGEYAVLEGAPAVLAAVSRHAIGQYFPDEEPASALISETVKRALSAMGGLAEALPTGSVRVDTSAFEQNGEKLGLGSSAAAAVATAAAIFENAGLDIDSHRDLVFAVADASHRAHQQGVGSGADVAAATYGGIVQFVRDDEGPADVTPMRMPQDLELIVFWTGKSASTPALIQTVRAFADRNPTKYAPLMAGLHELAGRFADAFAAGDATRVIAAAGAYGRAMGELGSASGASIVTPSVHAAAQLAGRLGGAAKPSGAGGGDIGVAFFTRAAAAAEWKRQCPPGVSVLDIRIDGKGARTGLAGEKEPRNKGISHG